MGIPKFYRWLCERYPLASLPVSEHDAPPFDSLYIDLNGILHPAAHPDDDAIAVGPHRPEHLIYVAVFNHIDHIVRHYSHV